MTNKLDHVMIIFLLLGFSAKISNAYNHFKLVLEWPVTFCLLSQSCVRVAPLNFTIHGLWPDDKTNRLSRCSTKPSDLFRDIKSSDTPSLGTVDYHWPDLEVSESQLTNIQKFWSHEWNVHGTCSLPTFKQAQYFQKAINLKNQFNILSEIKYQPGAYVDPIRVNNSIGNAIGNHLPRIHCERNMLSEVTICFQKDAVSLMNCPPPYIKNCGNYRNRVLLPK